VVATEPEGLPGDVDVEGTVGAGDPPLHAAAARVTVSAVPASRARTAPGRRSVVTATTLADPRHTLGIMAIPLVLDVDTGIDDACAILLAALHPGLDLRAVTCVGGNAPLPMVVRNTLTVLEAAGRPDVPVAAGAARPLLEQPVDARHVHGADGMGDLGMPAPSLALDPRHAVTLLRDTADAADLARERLTLVPLAPMTTIALFARTYPESFARLGRIVFMGGGADVSNATAAAEFNVFHDPEATALVLDACVEHGVPVTMYGLDVFYEPVVTRAQAHDLVALGSPVGRLAGGLVGFACRRFASDAATIGDAGAVATLLRPEAVRTESLPVRVELSGTWTRGRTIVDRRGSDVDLDHDPHGVAPATVDVALGIDGPAIAELWLRTMHGEVG
jgi:pyrimidine-specific ribonucleoside hydrolase